MLTQQLLPSKQLPFGGFKPQQGSQLGSQLGQMSKLLNTAIINKNANAHNDDNDDNDDDKINLYNMHEWEESGHANLWNRIITIDDSNSNDIYDNGNDGNDSNDSNSLLTSIRNELMSVSMYNTILKGDYIRTLSSLSLEFLIKELLRTITFARARKNQIKLLNLTISKKGNDINDGNTNDTDTSTDTDTDTSTDTSTNTNDTNDKLRKYEELTSYLSDTVTDDLSQMYQGISNIIIITNHYHHHH